MGCKFSKKGSCQFCKKCKERKAGRAEISDTRPIMHASQEASEGMESQPSLEIGKDLGQATTETLKPKDAKEALPDLQTAQSCDAQTAVQSTDQAFQENDAQPVVEMEQETREVEPNIKITPDRPTVAQTPKGNESQYAAEVKAGITKNQLDAELKQSPEAWHSEQDCRSASCITGDHVDQSVLVTMQEAGLMETTVQATAEIAEVQPPVEHMEEMYHHVGGAVTPQGREAMSETPEETGEDQAAAQDTLNTGEAKSTTQNIQGTLHHPPETQPTHNSMQGAEIQTSAQPTKGAGEIQPASETELLITTESELEAGETLPAGEGIRHTVDSAQESRARPVSQDRELNAQSLPAVCTTEVTKQTESALQSAPEGQSQTTVCTVGENWPAQAIAGTHPAPETRETGARGPFGIQSTAQTMEIPPGTAKTMEPMADLSMGPVENKASQSPLEPVTVPMEQTTTKPQPTAQVTQEVEAQHLAQIPELKEKQGQPSDLDSQPSSALAAHKETPGTGLVPGEEDQTPELAATEAAKPELKLNMDQVAPSETGSSWDAPENLVAKSQLLDSLPKTCRSKEEEAEIPRSPETEASAGKVSPSGPTLPSEESQQVEITDSMSEPSNLCRRTCCT